jgi:hypothetical protein
MKAGDRALAARLHQVFARSNSEPGSMSKIIDMFCQMYPKRKELIISIAHKYAV